MQVTHTLEIKSANTMFDADGNISQVTGYALFQHYDGNADTEDKIVSAPIRFKTLRRNMHQIAEGVSGIAVGKLTTEKVVNEDTGTERTRVLYLIQSFYFPV